MISTISRRVLRRISLKNPLRRAWRPLATLLLIALVAAPGIQFLCGSASAQAADSAATRGASISVANPGANRTYLDNGTGQGTAWPASGFDDSPWSAGVAPLGYGIGSEATGVNYGSRAGRIAASMATATATPTATATIERVYLPLSLTGAAAMPALPLRAAFYYPWFPEAWKQLGIYPYSNYHPSFGFYDSSNATVIKQHIAAMQYGGIAAGIASWWGQGTPTDRRLPALLSAAAGTPFRWAVYYEQEGNSNPSASAIRADLVYLRDHYGRDPSFLRINGRFVVFVYADGTDNCAMADRWKQANLGVNAYIVLRVVSGYTACASQPDGWHQYAPANAADRQGTYSYTISPGFDKVGETARLGRDPVRWRQNIRDMVASGARFQLITTFSEWGEGTSVESATQWASASGYGTYLDALHDNGTEPASPAANNTPTGGAPDSLH